jgi:DNA-binding beta-propeller fold protein YncE
MSREKPAIVLDPSNPQSAIDVNNRPGGRHLIVTAKTAHKVHFLDADTFTFAATLDMPGSTHELAFSADGRTAYGSIYGDGIFGKNVNPDRRIAVIDLPSRSLCDTIDLGGIAAPHGVMMDAHGLLWCTGELAESVFVIEPSSKKVERIAVGTAHWLAISHRHDKVFASLKRDELVVIDRVRRVVVDRVRLPHVVEGIAVTPDSKTVFACAQTAAEFYVIDADTHALRKTVAIDGANGAIRQMRRVRVSPDGRYVTVSSNIDSHVAIFAGDTLEQHAAFATGRAPMGFGFAADGKHAYVCCHDAALVCEFELASGRIVRSFPTAAGCEFIVAY